MIGIPGLSIPRRRRRASFTGAYDAVPNITAAYGMRRLRSAYTGSLLRMRRSSDNAESDFGYTGSGDLDTAAIVAWLSGSGYIVKWYDQSGNGYNAVQTTAASQPLYVASGQNGRPVLRWDGVNDWIRTASVSWNAQISIITTAKLSRDHTAFSRLINAESDLRFFVGTNSSEQIATFYGNGTAWGIAAANSTTTWLNTWRVVTTVNDGNDNQFVNGATITPRANALAAFSGELSIGGVYAGNVTAQLWLGDIAELIICNAALSTGDRQAAETAANDYWSIY